MTIIYQPFLFSWKDVDDPGDLERFQLVIESMPDQALLAALKSFRNSGRNIHQIESMWNSILAGVVFQHPSIESLRRELRRNAQLRVGRDSDENGQTVSKILEIIMQVIDNL